MYPKVLKTPEEEGGGSRAISAILVGGGNKWIGVVLRVIYTLSVTKEEL